MNEITNELEAICFGDQRLNDRSSKVLESLYEGIGNGLSASFGGSSEIKAAYRFFDNGLVNPEKILKPHYKKTIERINLHKIVGLIQDTTDIDMSHMEEVKNLGVLNDSNRPGCILHPVIAFTPDKLCLGIVDANFITRSADDLGKKKPNNSREIEHKESYRWIEGYKIACKVAEECPDTICVSIGDRESDIYELLVEATTVKATKNKAELLLRAYHNRSIAAPPSEENCKLQEENKKYAEEIKKISAENDKLRHRKDTAHLRKENSARIIENKKKIKSNKEDIEKDELIVNTLIYQLKKMPVLGTIEFILPAGRGKESRLVKQNIKAKTVIIKPSPHKKNLPDISINAVLLEEIETPDGNEPISWMFFTTLPINTLDEIQLIITLYLSRWGIELFFKVLKSGCKIEELRFQEAPRLLACVSIYMIVAWRILYSTFIGRACPKLSCTLLFEMDEWQSVYAVTMRSRPPEKPPCLEEFMKMIAMLGGYRNRQSDGPPGMKVMWIGIQAMHKLALGWQAYREFG